MILRRYSVHDMLGNFDPETGEFALSPISEELQKDSNISGTFDYLGGKLVLLYRLDGVLYLEFDGQRFNMYDITIELHPASSHCMLRVVSKDCVVCNLLYELPTIDPQLSDDPTPFVEEEHFDYGLFLANVSGNRNRQDRLYTNAKPPRLS